MNDKPPFTTDDVLGILSNILACTVVALGFVALYYIWGVM